MNNRSLLFICAWILSAFVGGPPLIAGTRLDTTFGLGGRIAVELGVVNSAHAVVVQPDGKIVVAGSSSQGTAFNFSLLRFNKDGSLDPDFNSDGSLITPISGGDNEALAVGLLSDGRIIAAGYNYNGTDRDFALVCYLQDGSLDLNFGQGGVVITSIGSSNEEITAITINSADMITVAGAVEGTVGRALVTARYFADGVLDSSYGEQGISLVGVGEDASAEGILERRDGSLVVSGSYKEKEDTSPMLVGLSPAGVLDHGFGDKGVAVPACSFGVGEGYGLAEGSGGTLYLAGSVGVAGERDTALFRFSSAGETDHAFGNQGALVTRVSAEDDILYAVTAGKKGLTASGFTTENGLRQFLLITFSGTASPSAVADNTNSRIIENAALQNAPVQEVRSTGDTVVRIRRLKVFSSFSEFTTVRYTPSRPISTITTTRESAQRDLILLRPADGSSFFAQLISGALGRLGNFLLPSAIAAESDTTSTSDASVSARVTTTSFGDGESVSYAATFDASGNVIVVGTADGRDASSIVVAQYATEEAIVDNTILNQPGHRSSYIITKAAADITQTTTVNGGEILPSLDKTVHQRGVVFSINKNPIYTDKSTTSKKNGSIALSSVKADKISSQTAFVTEGLTVNGSGCGVFSALLEKLKPGTIYYFRAYALTAEGMVYYGNQLRFRTADACFIATASFGTLIHPCVKVLRNFRDVFLLKSALGRKLVDLYYTFSPPFADSIAGNELLRFIVRLLLLPFIGFSWLALQGGMVMAVATFIGVLVMLRWLLARIRLRS